MQTVSLQDYIWSSLHDTVITIQLLECASSSHGYQRNLQVIITDMAFSRLP